MRVITTTVHQAPLSRCSSVGPFAAPSLRRGGTAVALFGNNKGSESNSGDAETKQLEAEKLALKAEIAELQAAELALKARSLAPDVAPAATAPPAPSVAAPSPPPPPIVADSSIAELCVSLERSKQVESSEALQRTVAKAWQEARVTQRAEIDRLRKKLAAADELQAASSTSEPEGGFAEGLNAGALFFQEAERDRKAAVDFNTLWDMMENRTTGNAVERRARARAVTRASFKFVAPLKSYDEEEEEAGADAMVAVPGLGLVSPKSDRQRLRLLERHEKAGCVEYRLFGAALSDDDALGDAASAPIDVFDELATAQMTSFLFRWLSSAFKDQVEQASEEEIKELTETLGVDDLEELNERTLAPWLEPLAELLGRSTLIPSGVDVFDKDSGVKLTLFPMLLAAVAWRQGNFEPLVVYYFSRLLARFNMQALARYEARDVPTAPDLLVTEQESSFVQKTADEALSSLGLSFVLLYTAFVGLAAYVLWQVVNAAAGAFMPPPYDPLNF